MENTQTSTHIADLEKLNACSEAVAYARGFSTLQDAWNACERGDWMLWLVGHTMNRRDEKELRQLIGAKAACARLVFHLMKEALQKKDKV